MLFVASSSKSHLINLDTKTVERSYVTTPVERRGLVYWPTARVVMSNQSRGCASLFSPAMQQPVLRCLTPQAVTASASTSDGAFLLVGTAEGNLYVWSTLSGELLHPVRSHTRRITEIAISSDQSLIATASEDSVCKTWLLAALVARGVSAPAPRIVFNGHSLSVNACSFLDSSQSVVTASSDRSCRIFDGSTGQQQFVVTLGDVLTSVRPSPGDEMLLIGGETGSLFFVRLYSFSERQCLPTAGLIRCVNDVVTCTPFTDGHKGAIVFIHFDYTRPDYVLVGSTNGVILWWNIRAATTVEKAVDDIAGGLLSVCYVPSDATQPSSAAVPPVVLQKHPLDPLGVDFIVVSAGKKESAPISYQKEGGSRASRRKRKHQQTMEDTCVSMKRTENVVATELEEGARESTGKPTSAERFSRLREKNDELEFLKNKLKEKLRKLRAAS
ncbi:WD domain, G-beta repeat, putative [Trypanosoma equiperdum]|uniref:WD domain, G-beta repeat, putative n=1 Tax=Trypanosoma equiperdum TaxID=5694 RepID=A0A1G4I2B8_TRYEQ|nr:WD domain, G-beta repeat, putative [Trypanosoma equiperdum]